MAGMAWHGRHGMAGRGKAGHGMAGVAWLGEARPGKAWQARHGWARRGRARHGRRGTAGKEPHEGKHMSPTPRKYQKTAALRVRLSEQQMACLKRLAREQGCSLSDAVRAILGQQLSEK
jgi:hypothetical protein